MKITELDINILAVPQGYYLAHGISRDMNFKVDFQHNLTDSTILKKNCRDLKMKLN